jgi:hypothetical protein
MPQYQCSQCKEVFLHLAKKVHFEEPKTIPISEDTTIQGGDTLETYVCPLCGSLRYTEVVEEKQGAINLADVISLKDCAPNDVDGWLAQGYVPFQVWQKNVFVVKLKPKPTEENQPNAYVEYVVNNEVGPGCFKITVKEEGKTVVFNNCQPETTPKEAATYGVCPGDCAFCDKPIDKRQTDSPCKNRIALGITTPSPQEIADMKTAITEAPA